ncbi:hypothetical protein X560_2548 [Listeria fleischmannii 1991]|uniref:Uncharacterized protein n=1 Tax=Listeria fleischmannii 1991 TaxID=1430899 RepID=A0A0J8G5K0_9LIST|nr:hypothetical protein X560_2548 [Listeria fleischmannii 1991]
MTEIFEAKISPVEKGQRPYFYKAPFHALLFVKLRTKGLF